MPKKVSTKRKTKTTIPAVVSRIQSVEDFEENHVTLLYGKAGRGKTKTAASWPTPNLFLDINNEKGLKTVRRVLGIEFTRVQTWDEFIELYWWLRDGQKYKTITLDQITGLQELCTKNVREYFKLEDGELLTGFKKFGKLSGDMKTWLGNYRELSDLYNITFLAHERAFDSDDGEDGEIDPSVSARVMPSIGSFIDGACDIIGQSFIRTVREKKKDPKTGKFNSRIEYALRIGPHPTYVTKIRRPPEAGRLPDFIIDPTYRKLVAIENGEIIRSTAKRRKVNGKKQKG